MPVGVSPLVEAEDPTGTSDVADIWALRIPADDSIYGSLDIGVLDHEELRRTGAFIRDVDRIRYAAAHIALRRVLAGYLGVPATAVRLHQLPCPNCGQPHGRPAVVDAGIHFSLSHGGEWVLIGVSGSPIGVDVEQWPRPEAIEGLAGALHPAERDEILAAPPGDARRAVFTRLWTRKEAYLKGIGAGLGRGTTLDYVGTGGPGKPAGPLGWTLLDIEVPAGDGYAAAIAAAIPALRLWQVIDLPFEVVRSSPGRQGS